MTAAIEALAGRVQQAASDRTPLCIRAGGTKDFYGNATLGETLDPRGVRGIVAYEPSELVVTVRCGTPLDELESTLAARGQMLACEPPHFGDAATVGGCIAAGLSGPRRATPGPQGGGIRDFLLGARLIDGRGQLLSFGGTVMKNVAGYDVARVLAGSLGILGVILEVSLKVVPRPVEEMTLQFELSEAAALERLNAWSQQALPISASAWHAGSLVLRLSGAQAAVSAASRSLGGEAVDGDSIWTALREHRHPYFAGDAPLWRLSLPPVAAPLGSAELQMIEWGGALRWLRASRPAQEIRASARALGGHATLFRGGDRTTGAFAPLAPALAAIHARLKAQFDPAGIFNPGRMYPEF
jgi:glycolate dehydrogenase FAD-binding subunit